MEWWQWLGVAVLALFLLGLLVNLPDLIRYIKISNM